MSFQLSLSTESVSTAYPDQPLFVLPTATVGEVIQLLRAQQTGSVLVCESDSAEGDSANNGKLLGIFTERDALKYMAAASRGTDDVNSANSGIMQQAVSTVMSTDVTTLQADASMGETIKTMSQGGYRHLPILDADGKPTGVENVYGIVHYLVDHFPQTIYNLPPNPRSITSEREGA
ncbi:MAG: CBS domain-containing protein [Planctomycetes bacterium]|nr:CBS domain-containing protein [Planctomycetota bacterium]